MLVFGLSLSPVCLSVGQISMDDSGHKGEIQATLEFSSSGCAVSNYLNYDSSLSLSVLVKVIPKFLIQPSVTASNRCVRVL